MWSPPGEAEYQAGVVRTPLIFQKTSPILTADTRPVDQQVYLVKEP